MRYTLKYALRQLVKSSGFTLVAIVMLALGIAMSTSTFSITNSVLLRAMPFPDSQQLVRIFRTTAEFDSLAHSPGNFLDLKAAATSFSNMAAYYPTGGNLAEPGQPPEQAYGLKVTATFLPTLGIQPFLGRGFAPDEDQPGKGNVMILTHSYWMKRFAGDPKVIGRTLRVGIDQLTVIGVLPPVFDNTLIWFGSSYLRPETIWPSFPTLRNAKWYDIVARMKPGATLRSVQPELTTLAARFAKDDPADNAVDNLRVTDLGSSFVDGKSRKLYWLITGLAASVLMIACANLASVQLARAFSRSHEFAIRSALGAGRLALMAPLLAESLLLSLGGGMLGVLLAHWANHLISHFFTGSFEIPMDGRVYLFACLAALLTGLTFGLAPAWLASRVSTGDALKESSRGSTSGRLQQRLKYVLIVGQLAFALVLVSAALSFGVAVRQSLKRDLGWQTAGLVSGVVGLPYEPYKPDEKKFTFVRALKGKLGSIPGVTQVAISSQVPLYGYSEEEKIVVEGMAPVAPGKEPVVLSSGVDAGFLKILNIPLKTGRDFPENIKAGDPAVIIVNETMARQYWPGQSALGKRLHFVNKMDVWCEVIGVAGDVRMNAGFSNPVSRLRIYRASEHAPSGNGVYSFILKSTLPPDTLLKPIRKAVGDMDPDILVQQAGGVDETLKAILAGNDLMIIILGSFAFIGLLIALIGLYGVITQLTLQRHREIGIRIALGADYFAVVRLILAQSGRLLFGGVIVGLAGAYAVSKIYQQTMPELQLPGVALQIGITGLLCVVGLLACYLPARRAGRIDPVVALRAE
jgi:putative ABC transport system permease protein